MNKIIYEETIGRIVKTNNIQEGDLACHFDNYKQGLYFFSRISDEDVKCQRGDYLKLVEDDIDEYNLLKSSYDNLPDDSEEKNSK